MYITEFYRDHFAPVYLARCKNRTRLLYDQILNLWVAKVGDLEISKISPADCQKFVDVSLESVRPATVAKYCRHMNTMFLKMSRPGYKNREAFGYIDDPPYCKPPRLLARLPKEVRDRDIVTLIDALSDIKHFPKCVDEKLRPKWWKSLVLFTVTTAVRKEVIFNVRWDAFDLERNLFFVSSEIDKVSKERIKFLYPNLVRLLLQIRVCSHYGLA